MRLRILTAAVGLPILAAIVWMGGLIFAIAVAVAAGIAAWELGRMARGWGQPSSDPFAVGIAAAIALAGHFAAQSDSVNLTFAVGLTVAILAGGAAAVLLTYRQNGESSRIARTVLTTTCIALFIGGTLFHATMIRSFSDTGLVWILFLLGVTFATDTGAYILGRSVGRHKMAPSISPGKTWEGAAGGFIGAVAAGLAIRTLVIGDGSGWPFALAVVSAAVMGISGQLGDLYESKLKRRAGMNDSGTIIPGHGGILDRLDSITFNLVAMVYLPYPLLFATAS